jgi:predicted metal-binding membrane protein
VWVEHRSEPLHRRSREPFSGGSRHAHAGPRPRYILGTRLDEALAAAPVVASLLALASIGWLLMVSDHEAGIGLMGMGAAGYLAAWTVMTAAMMLPAFSWFAVGYLAAIRRARGYPAGLAAILGVAFGYSAVWVASGAAALGVAWTLDGIGSRWPSSAPWIGAAVLVIAGVFQLSALKDRCLARCRSPFAFALHARALGGRQRDLRAGALSGIWCLACCWHLMLVLVVLGTMDIRWMAALTALVLLERAWRAGDLLVRAAGVGLIVAGVLAPWTPAIAPALHSDAPHSHQHHSSTPVPGQAS